MIRVLCLDSPAHPVGDHRPTLPGDDGILQLPTVGANSPWVTLGLYHPEPATAPRIAPAPETIVGLWPVRMLAQTRMLPGRGRHRPAALAAFA
jgi:hypothetical protein